MPTMMKKAARALLAVMALTLGLAACDNGDLPPAMQYSSFKGTVIDAVTNKPIPNATVVVDTVLTTTTDDNGAFSIDKVPSGIVDYVVSAKGYADMSASGNAEPGKPFTINITLQSQGSPTP
jgi:hypothetical protein